MTLVRIFSTFQYNQQFRHLFHRHSMIHNSLTALFAVAMVATTVSCAQVTEDELSPPDDLQAEIYVKYTWTFGTALITYQKPLVLFPDGTAFDEMPSGLVASFDPATLRTALAAEDKQEHVGTWRREGNSLVLSFAGKTRHLPQVERGWWDDEDPPDTDTPYKTYFPVLYASTEDILGPWKSESLFTVGMPGGDFTASGTTKNRVFFADGTFTEDEDRFVSSTVELSGGTYGAFGTNDASVAGRWRIDGPLLSIEEDGQWGVVLAFILPEWDDEDGDLWIGGDWWDRPEE